MFVQTLEVWGEGEYVFACFTLVILIHVFITFGNCGFNNPELGFNVRETRLGRAQSFTQLKAGLLLRHVSGGFAFSGRHNDRSGQLPVVY
jgi:amino acid permease